MALILLYEGAMMALSTGLSGGEGDDALGLPVESQITGLVANALGWDFTQGKEHERLQGRVRFAAVVLRRGHLLHDYQTADLSRPHLAATTKRPMWSGPLTGWTHFQREGRDQTPINVQVRSYWSDRAVLVALSLVPAPEAPTLSDIEDALLRPARPLFLGRTNCPPSVPILAGRNDIEDPIEAIRAACNDDALCDRRDTGPIDLFAPAEAFGETTPTDRVLVKNGRRAWSQLAAHRRHQGASRYILRSISP